MRSPCSYNDLRRAASKVEGRETGAAHVRAEDGSGRVEHRPHVLLQL